MRLFLGPWGQPLPPVKPPGTQSCHAGLTVTAPQLLPAVDAAAYRRSPNPALGRVPARAAVAVPSVIADLQTPG